MLSRCCLSENIWFGEICNFDPCTLIPNELHRTNKCKLLWFRLQENVVTDVFDLYIMKYGYVTNFIVFIEVYHNIHKYGALIVKLKMLIYYPMHNRNCK